MQQQQQQQQQRMIAPPNIGNPSWRAGAPAGLQQQQQQDQLVVQDRPSASQVRHNSIEILRPLVEQANTRDLNFNRVYILI